jgi:hypothetical protein
MSFEKLFGYLRRRNHDCRDGAQAEKENGTIFVSKAFKRTVSRQSQLVEISYDGPCIGSWGQSGTNPSLLQEPYEKEREEYTKKSCCGSPPLSYY